MHEAARPGDTNALELLLMKGASIEVMNEAGQTPLDVATVNHGTDIMNLLIKKAAELGNIRTVSGLGHN